VEDYELLDVGDGARLERFGAVVVDRPSPATPGPRRLPDAWAEATLTFDRVAGWQGREHLPADWTVEFDGVRLRLRPTDAGQVGCYPEHASLLPWARSRLPNGGQVLHGFASTGLVTLALARAGAAVTHVDSARPAVAWARENAALNGLQGRPIRWLVEDAARYVDREVRRGRRYDGVVLDPPTYGHGGGATAAWRIERDLPSLLARVSSLLAPGGFVLLTAHTETWGPPTLEQALRTALGRTGTIEGGDLALVARSGAILPLGAWAGWTGRA
jgi:23S rRNA (cytosine1962-C5)-methyltransferase